MNKFTFEITTKLVSSPFLKTVEASDEQKAWVYCILDLDAEQVKAIILVDK